MAQLLQDQDQCFVDAFTHWCGFIGSHGISFSRLSGGRQRGKVLRRLHLVGSATLAMQFEKAEADSHAWPLAAIPLSVGIDQALAAWNLVGEFLLRKA